MERSLRHFVRLLQSSGGGSVYPTLLSRLVKCQLKTTLITFVYDGKLTVGCNFFPASTAWSVDLEKEKTPSEFNVPGCFQILYHLAISTQPSKQDSRLTDQKL